MTGNSEKNYCKENLKICKAECCKQFTFHIPNSFDKSSITIGGVVNFFKILTKDKIKYYKLHGCRYCHGLLTVPINDFTIKDNSITIFNKCEGLTEDLECKYHGTTDQPIICHKPNKDDHENIDGVIITPNCIYYKK